LSKIKIILFVLSFVFLSAVPSFSGAEFDVPSTDFPDESLIGFFDLRDRETFIQITNVDADPAGSNIHIQIFDVSNNCNENNFFDFYTPFDTHIYNLRDIITNDGNPSGVVLPEDAYGIFTAFLSNADSLMGNLRILDTNGYEYRTNLQGIENSGNHSPNDVGETFATFNFNNKGNVSLSDVIAIAFDDTNDDVVVDDILNIWASFDVDIFDLNENAFSCRNVIYSCVNRGSSLYEALLEEVANECSDCGASVADIEYGINNAIPHSKGGELLCPGNTISEGFVRFTYIGRGGGINDDEVIVFVGLNNGNGRGSMDAFFNQNIKTPFPGGGGGM